MSRINVISRELPTFLSEQLGPLASSWGFAIKAEGPDVVVVGQDGQESRDGTAAILDEDDDPRGSADRAATAARAVLGHVQDVIARETGTPWPGAGSDLPIPGAAVEGGTLIAWFGDRDTPTWLSEGLDVSA